jgi:hypothetical protein
MRGEDAQSGQIRCADLEHPRPQKRALGLCHHVGAVKRRRPNLPRATTPTAVAASTTGTPYLNHPARVGLIFGSFFVLCVPLATLYLGTTSTASPASWLLLSQIYTIGLGYTHFAITFSIYLNSRNLEFFRSSPRNTAVYFGGPILILSTWFLIGFLGINERTPGSSAAFLTYLFYFALLTKLADYLHVVRQSFGVLQLFKKHVPAPFPYWMRRIENAFFIVLLALQLLTYTEGLKADSMNAARFNIDNPYTQLALGVAVVLFLVILSGYVLMARKVAGERGTLLVPLHYFLLQTASACLPIYWSTLYLASLAMHYVEYHVIMYPRVFQAPLALDSTVDRLSLWLRSHKIVFYVVLGTVAYLFMGNGINRLSAFLPLALVWFLLNLFNGVTMAHYFIEAFVWKFGEPFYRQTLAPLYFPSSAGTAKAKLARA